MKTSELTGALLDYWVARAEGIEEQLHLGEFDGVEYACWIEPAFGENEIYWPSIDWAQGGPLIEKHQLCVGESRGWFAGEIALDEFYTGHATGKGDTPLQAICRAVVRAAFGDEVGEVPEC